MQIKLLKKNPFVAAAILLAVLVPQLAFAQAQVAAVLGRINTMLTSAGVVVVTLAILWAGYKVMFVGARFADIAHIFMGAILIGGAAAFAGWLL